MVAYEGRARDADPQNRDTPRLRRLCRSGNSARRRDANPLIGPGQSQRPSIHALPSDHPAVVMGISAGSDDSLQPSVLRTSLIVEFDVLSAKAGSGDYPFNGLTQERCALKKNMGSSDRILRIAAAVLVAVLYFAGVLSGTIAVLLGIVAGIFLLTSLVGWCPAYLPFGLSTRR